MLKLIDYKEIIKGRGKNRRIAYYPIYEDLGPGSGKYKKPTTRYEISIETF